ncbi:hypothetical protein [Actibacterium sp. MT2.3-13A]|uniref:hypothetical protein n=1 Tax=Actibacterium sp. MT2.3-13A TaxID=2828332 RepID=UPI001BA5BE8D|nr:hypothetical protein [Actibacterium sp. MT2.3-13A]
MPHSPKIATCSYCGTRAALVLGHEGRHELTCASCGAPLDALKRLGSEPSAPSAESAEKPRKPRKPGKPKRRTSRARWLLGEVADFVEDVFD